MSSSGNLEKLQERTGDLTEAKIIFQRSLLIRLPRRLFLRKFEFGGTRQMGNSAVSRSLTQGAIIYGDSDGRAGLRGLPSTLNAYARRKSWGHKEDLLSFSPRLTSIKLPQNLLTGEKNLRKKITADTSGNVKRKFSLDRPNGLRLNTILRSVAGNTIHRRNVVL